MKILLDENISYRLITRIVAAFPDTHHVKDLGLTHVNDHTIFKQARSLGFDAIITNDDDFQNILIERGAPPKIIWLRTGNTITENIIEILKLKKDIIIDFIENPSHSEISCLEIN